MLVYRIPYTSYEHIWGFPNKRARHQWTAWIHIQTDSDGAPKFRCPVCNGHGCRRPNHLMARCTQCVERDLLLDCDSIIKAVAVEKDGARCSDDSCAVALLDESGNRLIAAPENWFSYVAIMQAHRASESNSTCAVQVCRLLPEPLW